MIIHVWEFVAPCYVFPLVFYAVWLQSKEDVRIAGLFTVNGLLFFFANK